MSATVPESHDVVKLDLSVGSVFVMDVDGDPYVVFRPAVEALGLSYPRQYRKLKTRSWACVAQRATQLPGDVQRRNVDLVPVRTFLMWLGSINENRVSETSRSALVAYQHETAKAVENYWTRGGAINPRAGATQLAELNERIRGLEEFRTQWEILAAEGDDFSVRDAAAILNRDFDIVTGQNMLFSLMRRWKMLDSKNRPYAAHRDHLVRRMGVEYRDQFGQVRIGGSQVRVTVAGMLYLHRRLKHALAN